MKPVTVADQSAVLDPEAADELIEVLRHAAAVIGALAGDPAAAAALAACPCGAGHDITALWWDLQLAAADLDEATTTPPSPPARNAQKKANAATRGRK